MSRKAEEDAELQAFIESQDAFQKERIAKRKAEDSDGNAQDAEASRIKITPEQTEEYMRTGKTTDAYLKALQEQTKEYFQQLQERAYRNKLAVYHRTEKYLRTHKEAYLKDRAKPVVVQAKPKPKLKTSAEEKAEEKRLILAKEISAKELVLRVQFPPKEDDQNEPQRRREYPSRIPARSCRKPNLDEQEGNIDVSELDI